MGEDISNDNKRGSSELKWRKDNIIGGNVLIGV